MGTASKPVEASFWVEAPAVERAEVYCRGTPRFLHLHNIGPQICQYSPAKQALLVSEVQARKPDSIVIPCGILRICEVPSYSNICDRPPYVRSQPAATLVPFRGRGVWRLNNADGNGNREVD